jgi:hypothetical protein
VLRNFPTPSRIFPSQVVRRQSISYLPPDLADYDAVKCCDAHSRGLLGLFPLLLFHRSIPPLNNSHTKTFTDERSIKGIPAKRSDVQVGKEKPSSELC